MLIGFGGNKLVQDMAKQPKAKAEAYGELKECRFQVLFTKTGLDKLDALAQRLGLSRSEFLERSVRWIDEHFDGQLQKDLGGSDEQSK